MLTEDNPPMCPRWTWSVRLQDSGIYQGLSRWCSEKSLSFRCRYWEHPPWKKAVIWYPEARHWARRGRPLRCQWYMCRRRCFPLRFHNIRYSIPFYRMKGRKAMNRIFCRLHPWNSCTNADLKAKESQSALRSSCLSEHCCRLPKRLLWFPNLFRYPSYYFLSVLLLCRSDEILSCRDFPYNRSEAKGTGTAEWSSIFS